MKISIRFTMPGINPIITDHFEMFFRNMLGKPGYEIKNRNGFGNQLLVFVAVVMEGKKIAVIRSNTWSGNDWAAKGKGQVIDYF